VITRDVVNLFHHLTGYSTAPAFERLLVAPVNMRERFIELIRREVGHLQAGRPARIIAKMNQLEDLPVCEALAEASQAGVRIDLVIRGFCCLRPGIPGWTENLRVRSIIGRFLEHGRLFPLRERRGEPARRRVLHRLCGLDGPQPVSRVEAVTPVRARNLPSGCGRTSPCSSRPAQRLADAARRQLRAAARREGASEVARDGTHVTHMKRTRAASGARAPGSRAQTPRRPRSPRSRGRSGGSRDSRHLDADQRRLRAACAFCSAAANLNEWLGTTRSSRSAVVISVAG